MIEKQLLQFALHKSKNILDIMNKDITIHPLYKQYAEWIKEDIEFILNN
jgi:2-hydroxy-3-keto-5-methylthiopentenyl-1-phosphate phosphatase